MRASSIARSPKISVPLSLVLYLAVFAETAPAFARAQVEVEEEPARIIAYVDPDYGNDATGVVSDPDKPFRKLQTAIDRAYAELAAWDNPVAAGQQATVVALEGVYGPNTTPVGTACGSSSNHNGPHASGDTLPIKMRDRVHVKGVGARRCILRGIRCGDVNTSGQTWVFWPSSDTADGSTWELSTQSEVLLDLSETNIAFAPWFSQNSLANDLIEVFDGFTFQSGDVQVLATSGYDTAHLGEPKAIVSNCVFDMRHGFSVPGFSQPVAGPTFGVLMIQAFVPFNGVGGYVDQKVLITQNSFIMAHYTPSGWAHGCLPNAVGLMNVNDPGCSSTGIDCDRTLYGLARCGVVGNLFRTPPVGTAGGAAQPIAMLGINNGDTKATGNGSAFQETNAYGGQILDYDSGSVFHVPWSPAGYTSFFSKAAPVFQVPAQPLSYPFMYHPCPTGAQLSPSGTTCSTPCSSTPCVVTPYVPGGIGNTDYPAAAVPVFFQPAGCCTGGNDPRFVGEYLTLDYSQVVGSDYVDWRLLPGSTFRNSGVTLDPNRTIVTANGSFWNLKTIPDVDPFRLDGEGYGNRRVFDGASDLGFDEVQWFIMAGSYANYSNSHNKAGFLNRTVLDAQPTRFWIMPHLYSSVALLPGDKIQVFSTSQTPPNPPKPAWYQPPATLLELVFGPVPPLLSVLSTKYISFSAIPTWEQVYDPQLHFKNYHPPYLLNAPGGPYGMANDFALFTQVDNECAAGPCVHEWFNTQVVVRREPNDKLWSNLQTDYR